MIVLELPSLLFPNIEVLGLKYVLGIIKTAQTIHKA